MNDSVIICKKIKKLIFFEITKIVTAGSKWHIPLIPELLKTSKQNYYLKIPHKYILHVEHCTSPIPSYSLFYQFLHSPVSFKSNSISAFMIPVTNPNNQELGPRNIKMPLRCPTRRQSEKIIHRTSPSLTSDSEFICKVCKELKKPKQQNNSTNQLISGPIYWTVPKIWNRDGQYTPGLLGKS